MSKLDKADVWLINEITEGLCNQFRLNRKEAFAYIKKSNFMRLLQLMPEQVHHDTPSCWIDAIAKQFGLKDVILK